MRRGGVTAARVGFSLSGLLLAYAVAALISALFGPDCFQASKNVATAIELTTLAVLGLIVLTLVLNVWALRAGGRAADWGRYGISLWIVAIIVLAWAWVDSFGDLLACAEGD